MLLLRHLRFVAMATLIWSGTARAEWTQTGVTDSGAQWFVDPFRVRRVGSHQQAWVKIDYSRDRTVTHRSSLRLFSLNCTAQTMKLISLTDYDSYGKVIRSDSFPDYGSDTGYSPIVPESVGEAVMNVACAGTN